MGNDEQLIENLDNYNKTALGFDLKPDDHSKTEPKPTESVIKRGVPKNTKPASPLWQLKWQIFCQFLMMRLIKTRKILELQISAHQITLRMKLMMSKPKISLKNKRRMRN